MGWRFRRLFSLGPFRATMSKSGMGVSVGIPGLRYGVSPNGQRYISVGIPGTGLYWIKYLPQKGVPLGEPPPHPPQQPKHAPPPAEPWWKQKG